MTQQYLITMETNKELDDILRLIDNRRLSGAMEALATFGCKYPELNIGERLDSIRGDYERMAGYWSQGYRDPQLDSIYDELLRRVYRLTADTCLRYATTHSSFMAGICRRLDGAGRDWSEDVLRRSLETFVTDLAMLGLEPEHIGAVRKAAIHAAHQQMMNDLFDYIWTSPQWSDGMAATFEQILLSPTVDANDQLLIVSALMLSAMNIFDICKFRILVNVYRRSVDENVRQRALVGWVLSMGQGRDALFAEQRQLVDGLLADGRVCAELTELQIQLLYCMMAESDNSRIQKEIMPELLKHNNLRITPGGIEEKAEDPMQDILDPEASERNMEKVEESFRKMKDMQKAGSDIYFGGFSQMKRFPFFDSISNWFVPFYPEHPAISGIYGNDGGPAKFLKNIVKGGMFCDSDKYSFVIAFKQVVDRIPKSMREMFDNGGAMMGVIDASSEMQQTPAYIRRFYLQNLYRFFRLYPLRGSFFNPFDHAVDVNRPAGYVFFANPLFRETLLESRFGEIAAFMVKRKMYAEAAGLLGNYSEKSHDYQYYMLAGAVLASRDRDVMQSKLAEHTAEECFRHAVELRPDEPRAVLGHARSLFGEGRYAEARDAYATLLRLQPDNMACALSYSVCLTNLEQYDEAMKVLYRLSYEHAGNSNVDRVMARALTGSGKYEQARNIYERLCGSDGVENEDIINSGYCEWLSGNNLSAAGLFARYLKKRYPQAGLGSYGEYAESDIIMPEEDFLKGHGVTPTEIQLMVDLICATILR